MTLQVGCVGLPNVGKSTLFNTLTKNTVPAENYPFCTIEPNKGIALVPDSRLKVLADLVHTQNIIPAPIQVIDIAGLVKGASSGEGLGNQFLSHIREVDLILHVVRLFEDEKIVHVGNEINPKQDVEIIETELALKDLEVLDKLLSSRRISKKEQDILSELHKNIREGVYKDYNLYSEDDQKYLKGLGLLTIKPKIYVLNISEEEASKSIMIDGLSPSISLSVKLEYELSTLDEEEKSIFLEEYGLSSPALDKLIKEAFSTLGLITFFTAGEKEVRAWSIKKGTKAPEASGTIHTDFENKFIRLEVVKYRDFVSYGGWEEAKSQGKMSTEGKDYEVQDGDIVIVRHGA